MPHNKQQAGIIIICTEERGGKDMTGTKKNVQISENTKGKVSFCPHVKASTYTRKLIYSLQEAHFTQSLDMTVAHEYSATFSTRQHVLARECQSVEASQFLN